MADVPVPRPDRTPGVSRAALDRVLARAAELQVRSGDDEGALTEAQLIELGNEVGLSPAHLRQALAEERSRVEVAEEPGWVAGIAGPGTVTASRAIAGRPSDLLASLGAWMEKEECLRVRRRFADRVSWEPRTDFRAQINRNINGKGRSLTHVDEVAATVVALDASRTMVRLDADVSGGRRARLIGGGVAAGASVIAGGTFGVVVLVAKAAAVLAVGAAALPLVAGIGGAYLIARTHRPAARRAQLGLEQLLDRLEHGDMRLRPPSLIDVLADAAVKAIRPPAR